eukprot:TRINITY_DN1829_c0_g1_i2.p2 TRINITY_DN1829_c0_g1~~TRINITY_DN1829_c0_g1_i2.p2  ORF type:complete len:286 (-),score=86.12 TRINITY_DN1829_c0_g1_i2:1013-1870(-)
MKLNLKTLLFTLLLIAVVSAAANNTTKKAKKARTAPKESVVTIKNKAATHLPNKTAEEERKQVRMIACFNLVRDLIRTEQPKLAALTQDADVREKIIDKAIADSYVVCYETIPYDVALDYLSSVIARGKDGALTKINQGRFIDFKIQRFQKSDYYARLTKPETNMLKIYTYLEKTITEKFDEDETRTEGDELNALIEAEKYEPTIAGIHFVGTSTTFNIFYFSGAIGLILVIFFYTLRKVTAKKLTPAQIISIEKKKARVEKLKSKNKSDQQGFLDSVLRSPYLC